MINPRPDIRNSAHQRRKNVKCCLFQSDTEKRPSYRHTDMISPLLNFRGIMVHCRKLESDFQKMQKV